MDITSSGENAARWRETVIDGVPVLFAEGPAPAVATLVFGVGRRDEDVIRGGITHLVEHLTMRREGEARRGALDHNATVEASSTSFYARGRPEQIALHLTRIASSLSELALDVDPEDLRIERDVLRAETRRGGTPSTLFGERYGGRDLGLLSWDEPALGSLGVGDVQAWIRQWFVRENAAVTIVGPDPQAVIDAISLQLPVGRRPDRAGQTIGRWATRAAWTSLTTDDLQLSLELPETEAGDAVGRLLRYRIEAELRHRRGFSYHVDSEWDPVEAGTAHLLLVADVLEQHTSEAAHLMWAALTDLAANGPTDEELGRFAEWRREEDLDPLGIDGHLHEASVRRLRGLPPCDHSTPVGHAVVREAALTGLATALLGVPEELDDPDIEGLPEHELDSGPAVTGRRHLPRPRFDGAPLRARLIVGEEGVSLILPIGTTTVRWRQVVALMDEGDGLLLLLGDAGQAIPLEAEDWFGGEAAVRTVRDRVPARLHARSDDAVAADLTRPIARIVVTAASAVLTAVILVGAAVFAQSYTNLRDGGVTVTGVVSDIDEDNWMDVDLRPAGIAATTSDVGDAGSDQVGDRVEVTFHPDDPTYAVRAGSREDLHWAWGLAAASVVPLLTGLSSGRSAWRATRRRRRLLAEQAGQ